MVGAGVIGLAIARRIAIAGHEVVVLEKEIEIATHTSSRNSEVIHAGIYYPKASFKADFVLLAANCYMNTATRNASLTKRQASILLLRQRKICRDCTR